MSVSPVSVERREGLGEAAFEAVDIEDVVVARVAPANDCEPDRHVDAERHVAALCREHRAAILARCRRLLHDGDAAEDATQETFVRVVRHARKAPAGREALAWMIRIATNYCLNELRNRRTSVTTFELPDVAGEEHRSVEAEVVSRDLARKVLATVPEKVRVVALLRHVGGMFDAEIADALSLGRRTVVYRLAAFRARAARRLASER